MLVLSRKVGERVLVGDKVVITVVKIGPNAIRLGIEAPKDMNIVREELVDPNAVIVVVEPGGGSGEHQQPEEVVG
jgi:carbon storage regulator